MMSQHLRHSNFRLYLSRGGVSRRVSLSCPLSALLPNVTRSCCFYDRSIMKKAIKPNARSKNKMDRRTGKESKRERERDEEPYRSDELHGLLLETSVVEGVGRCSNWQTRASPTGKTRDGPSGNHPIKPLIRLCLSVRYGIGRQQ